MKIKFNKFEKVAGVFVALSVIGLLAATVGVFIQKGWFSSKVEFSTLLVSAEGIHVGTAIQIAGLRAGEVKDIELLSAKEVLVKFKVLEKFYPRIRTDSYVQVIRPFIIGEKVIEISVGSESKSTLKPHQNIIARESMDLMDLVSGRKLAPAIKILKGLVGNLKILAGAFSDSKRMKAFINMFDRLGPMISNVNQMSAQFSKLGYTLNNKKKLENLLVNLNDLSEEVKKISPAISEVAPQLPQASLRALEALDEAVVLLKAMQRSWVLKKHVKDVRKLESKEDREYNQDKTRWPASQD